MRSPVNKSLFLLGAFALFFLISILFIQGANVLFSSILVTTGTLIIYYAFKIFTKDSIKALFFLVLSVLLISFVPAGYQLATTFLVLGVSTVLLIVNAKDFKKLFISDLFKINDLSFSEKFLWFMLAMVLLVLCMSTSDGVFVFEQHHSFAELSLANSYSRSILNAPNLSYNLIKVKYHFLATQIPLYFSNIFNLPKLETVYFVIPLFFMLITFILTNSFFSKYPIVRVPIFILFFLPLIAWSAFGYENLSIPMLYSTCSYLLAFALMTMGAYFLISKQKSYLILTACLLIVIKVAFFFTLFGGAFLFFLKKKEIKNMFVVCSSLILAFVVLYILFLSGSHSYNVWVVFPSFLFSMAPSILISNNTLDIWRMVVIFIPFALFWAVIYTYFKKGKNDVLLGLSSISLSGILGILLLTEITESNSWHFYIAAFFPTALIFWFTFKNILQNNKDLNKKLAILLLYCFVVITMFFSSSNLILKNLARFSVHESKFLQGIYRKMLPGKNIPMPLYSNDLINAYTWLKDNTEKDSVVFFGKHYELQDVNAKKWEPSTAFIRSALSDRQMYCENFQYKGIGSQKDYPLRFASAVYFYSNFVDNSNKSKALLSLSYKDNFGKEPARPLSEHKELSPIVHYFRFGKEWTWLNMPKQIDFEIKQNLKGLDSLAWSQKPKWLKDFLEAANIDYVVLENYDKPNNFLRTVSQEVYADKSVEILKVNK